MKIVVCIKQVPASESKIVVKDDAVDFSNISYLVNPYDEFAVEEGLQIKERLGEGEVIVMSVGPDRVIDALRTCLAVGADRAVHIKYDDLASADSFVIATILAAAIKPLQADIILFGKQAIDDDIGAVGIQTAELLGMPHVSIINKFELEDGKAIANRQIEGGAEVVEVKLPGLFTCQKELNVPRYASLPGIMKAKSKPLEIHTPEDFGIGQEHLKSSTTVTRFLPPAARTAGRIITGEPSEAVKELVTLLREDARVI